MALSNGLVEVFDLIGGTPLAVAGVTTVWTPTYIFRKGVTYSIEYQFASPGTVECDIDMEQGNIPPATESAISTDMVEVTAIVSGTASKLVTVVLYSPVVTKFLRGKIAGTGANNAGTTLSKFNICAVGTQ